MRCYYSTMFYIHWNRVSHSNSDHFEKYLKLTQFFVLEWCWLKLSLMDQSFWSTSHGWY